MFVAFFLAFLPLLSLAQLTRTVAGLAGNSVVVVISTNPAGQAITQTISTVQATTTTPPVVNVPDPARGPVGQPDQTNPAGGITPFVYTTSINGVRTVLSDNFTPTNPQTVSVTPTGTGTVWSYDDWVSRYGSGQGGGGSNGCRGVGVGGWMVLAGIVIIINS